MRRSALAAGLTLAAVLIAGCGSSEPSVEDQACESIKAVTPGFLEAQWNIATLSDPSASQQARLTAMREQLDAKAGRVKYARYQCSGPIWDRYLAEYRQK